MDTENQASSQKNTSKTPLPALKTESRSAHESREALLTLKGLVKEREAGQEGQARGSQVHIDDIIERLNRYETAGGTLKDEYFGHEDIELEYAHLQQVLAKPLPAGDDRSWHYTVSQDDEGNKIKIKEALSKNINYWPSESRHFAEDKHKYAQARFIAMAQEVMGQSAIVEILNKLYHAQHGSQMVVEQNVSSDLVLTDMDSVGIEDIPFPCDSLEFFFEDPKLPTVLVYKGTVENQLTRLGLHGSVQGSEVQNDSINFWVEGHAGAGMAFRASEENWNQMINADNSEIDELKGSVAFEDDEWEQMRHVFKLCIKVLAYASIPRLKPQLVSKKSLKRGGRPNVKNRPARPIMRVIYLPEVKREKREPKENQGGKHKFLGRRGVMRYYAHERYVNMQGKWQYIPPVRGPNGEIPKVLYKVIKPKKEDK